MSYRDDINKLIDFHNRRLQKLKEQQAIYGISADPSISIQIEDIEAEIQELQAELKLRESLFDFEDENFGKQLGNPNHPDRSDYFFEQEWVHNHNKARKYSSRYTRGLSATPPYIEAFNPIHYSSKGWLERTASRFRRNNQVQAFEVLVSHFGTDPIWISEAIIGSDFHYRDGCKYMYFEKNYKIILDVSTSAGRKHDNSINGIITEDDTFGRNITGRVTYQPHYCGAEFSFPLYLELVPNSKTLLRFVVDKISKRNSLQTAWWKLTKIGRALSDLPTFKVDSEKKDAEKTTHKTNTPLQRSDRKNMRMFDAYGRMERLDRSSISILLQTDQDSSFGACLTGTSLGYI